ncbi:MAG: thermonuclease family protein [Acidimicrobiales bacterium]
MGLAVFRVAVLAAVTVVLGAACTEPASSGDPSATVVSVVDGDTIVVKIDGKRTTVRLIGIDTPETVAPNRPVGCFGPEASKRTAALLPAGTAVRLERDVEARDVYGRLLAYVYRRADGLFVNEDLVAGGFADVLRIPPNTAHAERLTRARSDARRERRGLWGACPAFGAPRPG